MKTLKFLIPLVLLVLWAGCSNGSSKPTEKAVTAASGELQTAILAGGCFWCVENDMMKLDGVVDAVSGYAGGERPNPTYDNYDKATEQYSRTHIEVVEVSYDPSKLSYQALLEYFFRQIDPTDGEGQFCDRGQAYRPAIFVTDDDQEEIANVVKDSVADELSLEIDVPVKEADTFWPAEEYHQNYAQKNPTKYKYYRWNCNRDQRLDELWGENRP